MSPEEGSCTDRRQNLRGGHRRSGLCFSVCVCNVCVCVGVQCVFTWAPFMKRYRVVSCSRAEPNCWGFSRNLISMTAASSPPSSPPPPPVRATRTSHTSGQNRSSGQPTTHRRKETNVHHPAVPRDHHLSMLWNSSWATYQPVQTARYKKLCGVD